MTDYLYAQTLSKMAAQLGQIPAAPVKDSEAKPADDFRKLLDNRYQGWGAGAGIAYGYAWPVHRHWNIEAEIGFGWIYTRFDSYPCAECGRKIDSDRPHNYVGPTKAALNIVYLF